MNSNNNETASDVRKEIVNILTEKHGKADITTRTEMFSPVNFRKVGIEYQKIKKKFVYAAKHRSKENWLKSKIAHENFIQKIYPLDIDAISEYSTICMHYALYVKDESERMKIFADAIQYRSWASRLEYGNLSHKIKLGQNYRISKRNKEAIDHYEELAKSDPKNIVFKFNLAFLYIAQSDSGNKQNKIENIKKLESILTEIKSLKENDPAVAILTESLNRIKENQTPLEYRPRNEKDFPANSSLNETRLGVLLYLRSIGKGALASEIKQEWLVNSETTKNVLSQMTTEKLLDQVELISGNNAYLLSEIGKKETDLWYHAIDTLLKDDSEKVGSWIMDDEKYVEEMHGGFSKRFLKKFYAWNSKNNGIIYPN